MSNIYNFRTINSNNRKHLKIALAVLAAFSSLGANAQAIEGSEEFAVDTVVETSQGADYIWSGIIASSPNISVSILNNSTLKIQDKDSKPNVDHGTAAVYVKSGADAFLFNGNLEIDVSNSTNSTRAFWIESDAALSGTIAATATAVGQSNLAEAVKLAGSGKTLTFDGKETYLKAQANGGRTLGVENWGTSGGIINFNADKTAVFVSTTKDSANLAQGVLAYQSLTNFEKDAFIKVEGGTGFTYGVDGQADPGDAFETIVNFNGRNTTIDAEGTGTTFAISSSGVPVKINLNGEKVNIKAHSENDYAAGIRSRYGALVAVAGDVDMQVTTNSSDKSANGIWIANYSGYAGNVDIKGTLTANVHSQGGVAFGIYNDANTQEAPSSSTDGKVRISNANIVAESEGNDALGIYSYGDLSSIVIANGAHIQAISNTNAYAVNAEAQGNVQIGSGDEAKGSIDIVGDIASDAESSIHIGNGNNVVNVTGAITDGSVGTGQVPGSSAGITLNMNEASVWNVTGDSSIKTLSGDGTVRLGVEHQDEKWQVPSSLMIENVTSGRLNLGFNGVTADEMTVDEFASMMQTSEIEVSETEIVAVVDEGDVQGAITQVTDVNGRVQSVTQAANNKLTAFSSVNATNLLQWRHEMNDLTRRMGELRTSPEGVGAWARLYGSEQEYGDTGTETKNTTIQVGADYDVGAGWKVGAAFSYTDSSSSMNNGSADGDMYGLAVYGTWFNDDGQFLDLIGKYSRMSTDFVAGNMSGDYDNNAYGVSVEYGWHLKFSDLAFVEPQAELTYGRVMGDDFTTSNAVRIEQDDVDSFIGRLGVRGGFFFPENKGTIYARASVLHDFDGESSFKASNTSASATYTEDMGGTWYEFGIGANFNLTDATYAYVDLEKSTGGEVKENWRWNVGLRSVFW